MKLLTTLIAAGAVVALCSAAPAAAQAARAEGGQRQGRGPGKAGNPNAPGVTPGDVQKMFDAYALMQAQEQLKIPDEKFTPFLTRFKALQDVRRSNMTQRVRMVQDLRQLTNDAPPDETRMRERLKALDELDARAQIEIAKAYDAINQVLDIPQQAKFRVFEENMENRKLALVMRARQANRPKL